MMIKNKRGSMVLRDIVMLIIVFSGIIALASIFVNDIGDTYSNTNMTSSYNQDAIGENQLSNTSQRWKAIGNNLNGNLLEMLTGALTAMKEIFTAVITAPATFINMLMTILEDIGVDESITVVLGFIITAVLYILIVFIIISAKLQGGKI